MVGLGEPIKLCPMVISPLLSMDKALTPSRIMFSKCLPKCKSSSKEKVDFVRVHEVPSGQSKEFVRVWVP